MTLSLASSGQVSEIKFLVGRTHDTTGVVLGKDTFMLFSMQDSRGIALVVAERDRLREKADSLRRIMILDGMEIEAQRRLIHDQEEAMAIQTDISRVNKELYNQQILETRKAKRKGRLFLGIGLAGVIYGITK